MNIAQAIDTLDVTNVVLAERTARDRSDWDAMRATYDPNSFVHLSWYRGPGAQFVDASQRMHEQFGWQATHRLSPPRITFGTHPGRALADVGVAIEMRQPLDTVEVDVTSYGNLLYRARRTPDGWLLTHLTMIYQRDTLVPVVPGVLPTLDLGELTRHRPSYRYLAYVAERGGATARTDLPGSDRPELVTATHQSARSWLDTDGN